MWELGQGGRPWARLGHAPSPKNDDRAAGVRLASFGETPAGCLGSGSARSGRGQGHLRYQSPLQAVLKPLGRVCFLGGQVVVNSVAISRPSVPKLYLLDGQSCIASGADYRKPRVLRVFDNPELSDAPWRGLGSRCSTNPLLWASSPPGSAEVASAKSDYPLGNGVFLAEDHAQHISSPEDANSDRGLGLAVAGRATGGLQL